MKKALKKIVLLTIFVCFVSSLILVAEEETKKEKILETMHSISSYTLLNYIKELTSEKYKGRLTGTEGFNMAARWVASKLKGWGISPAGDDNTYFQAFKNPYTLILEGDEAYLHIPVKRGQEILKHYILEKDFIPGSTSDSGEVTAEVVYVGYGITAPELGYDDYKGVNVKGKIVLMEREVPVPPEDEKEFKKWRPYSFHQYKVKNAKAHGAAGMLYIYHITNPNCVFIKNFILTYIGKEIVNDLFKGLKYTHREVVEKIKREENRFHLRQEK